MKTQKNLAVPWTSVALAASTCAHAQAPKEKVKTATVTPGTATGIAPGWPVLLRGSVSGTPVVADMDGDGRLEIVAPALHSGHSVGHPDPVRLPQLWALRADGTVVQNWPITLPSAEGEEARRTGAQPRATAWYSSPTVCDVDGDGADEIISGLPHTKERRVHVVYGDGGTVPASVGGGEPWASIPAADLDSDGVPDMVGHDLLSSVRGQPLANWKARRPLHIYQPAIADANGDGDMEIFVGTFQKDWDLPGQPDANRLEGWDSTGKSLPGWPRHMISIVTHLSVGNVIGDAKKEIVAVDHAGNLHVWAFDGKPAAPSKVDKLDLSIVRANIYASNAPPCLADLDGDGRAEIILLNGRDEQTLVILRGDGQPFAPDVPASKVVPRDDQLPGIRRRDPKTKKIYVLDPRKPDDRKELVEIFHTERHAEHERRLKSGGVATVRGANSGFGGVAAVDLGGDGVMDVFVGTLWVKVARDGTAQITPMIPEEEAIKVVATGSPSVADVDGDGLAEVAFGLSDGRLFLFRTGLALAPKDAHWPTSGGNFQHTGVWKPMR